MWQVVQEEEGRMLDPKRLLPFYMGYRMQEADELTGVADPSGGRHALANTKPTAWTVWNSEPATAYRMQV